ncbi:DUF1648 domain-containing protein [Streptomyces virginiae]|uniref:DUF1648 domain-containing protein n=1 Tax=Streptomyces virginiae TaxID=1961 RepID=UPI00131E145B
MVRIDPIRRLVTLTVAPYALSITLYVSLFLSCCDRIPEQMATYFSWDGDADGFTSRTATLWFGVLILAGFGVLFALLA